MEPTPNLTSPSTHYHGLLFGRAAGEIVHESASEHSAGTTPSGAQLQSRIETSRRVLHELADAGAADPRAADALSTLVRAHGEAALRDVWQGDDDALHAHPIRSIVLEAIIQTDGTRPSFLVVGGEPDLSSLPGGEWEAPLRQRRQAVRAAITSVGRIDARGYPQGTGFLVQHDVLFTNRHVLQMIGERDSSGSWTINGATVDFGFEGGASPSQPHAIDAVLFAAADVAGPGVDHRVLDAVLLRLATSASSDPLSLSSDIAWGRSSEPVYVVGYPADPGFTTYTQSILDRTFSHADTYGRKRLAPGRAIPTPEPVADWTMSHDATTLGGSSGSPVLRVRNETVAAAIHYSGRPLVTNWAHVIARTLAAQDACTGRILREILYDHDVSLVSA